MKKRKKIMLVILLIIIIPILTIFTIRYFKYKKNIDDIKTIKISNYNGYLSPSNEYIIDFDKNLVTYNYTYFNQSNEDNQYSSRNFTKEDAEYFIEKANLYGFFNWKKSYKTKHGGNDLPYTYISIIYKNDDIQIIDCYNAYPLNYDKMGEVLYEAFGYDIFLIFTY